MADTLATNDRARYDYEILDTLEAGLVLTGQEVKSAKFGGLKLKGAHVIFRGKEPWLLNAHIPKYNKAGPLPEYDPERSRKLLMRSIELTKLRKKLEVKGLTIIPIRGYLKGGRIKIEVGLARGKKEYEKRESIKKRDVDRELRGRLKRAR